jgi:hypothetical protein
MFDKVSSQKLRQLSEELGRIGDQEPEPGAEQALSFARGLAALMRCELTDRSWKNVDPE